MKTVTQTILYRQALIHYANKYGVTKAAIRYKTNRQYIYRWKNRYGSMLESLADRSRRPHHHPNQHTEEKIKLIMDMRKRNMNDGLVVFWVKLRQKGYTRCLSPGSAAVAVCGILFISQPTERTVIKAFNKSRNPSFSHSSPYILLLRFLPQNS